LDRLMADNATRIGDVPMPLQSDLDALPKTLQFVATKPLFVLRLGVGSLQIVGATPAAGHRQADGPVYSVFEIL